MDTPGYILLSRLTSQIRATDVLAGNIANADTPGFRSTRMLFGEALQQQTGTERIAGARPLAFAQDKGTWRDVTIGQIQTTGNTFDFALQGPGFFVVDTPRGERYTRAGRFSLSNDGQMVDPDGNPVLGRNGTPLSFSPNDTRITVLGDGTVRSENGDVGRIQVVQFEDLQRLKAEGNRLYDAGSEQPEPLDRPEIVQGAVEGSNVRPIIEINSMTMAMREFQFASNFLDRENERITGAVDKILRRR